MPFTNVLTFCNDLANLIELNITKNRGKLLLVGDFNIHLDEPTDSDIILFTDTLESLDLQNMVVSYSQIRSHTRCNNYRVQFTFSLVSTHRSSILGPQIHSYSIINNKASTS